MSRGGAALEGVALPFRWFIDGGQSGVVGCGWDRYARSSFASVRMSFRRPANSSHQIPRTLRDRSIHSSTELLRRCARIVVGEIPENTEDTGCERPRDWHCHPGEPLYERSIGP